MHATTESRRPAHYESSRPVLLAVARQAPVHLTPTEEQIWLKMSSRLGQVFTGEELLAYAWSRKGYRWDDPDPLTRTNNRQHVIGILHELRRVLHSHGQFTIDTCYPKADGKRGWRLREMTAEDRAKLRGRGYFGGSWYEHQLAGPAERLSLSAGEADGAIEHHAEIVGPLRSEVGWPVDDQGRAFEGDVQLLEPADVAG